VGRVQLLAVVQHEDQAEAKHVDDVHGQRQQEQEEVSVVPAADAVVHPRAVVVKVLPGWEGGRETEEPQQGEKGGGVEVEAWPWPGSTSLNRPTPHRTESTDSGLAP